MSCQSRPDFADLEKFICRKFEKKSEAKLVKEIFETDPQVCATIRIIRNDTEKVSDRILLRLQNNPDPDWEKYPKEWLEVESFHLAALLVTHWFSTSRMQYKKAFIVYDLKSQETAIERVTITTKIPSSRIEVFDLLCHYLAAYLPPSFLSKDEDLNPQQRAKKYSLPLLLLFAQTLDLMYKKENGTQETNEDTWMQLAVMKIRNFLERHKNDFFKIQEELKTKKKLTTIEISELLGLRKYNEPIIKQPRPTLADRLKHAQIRVRSFLGLN